MLAGVPVTEQINQHYKRTRLKGKLTGRQWYLEWTGFTN